MSSQRRAHSAYLIFQVIKNRVIEKVVPSLGRKSKAQQFFSIALILLTVLGTIGIGIYLDGYVIHPPTHFTGVCASPAHITNGGRSCMLAQVQTVVRSGTTTTTVVQVPAGVILLPNGTASK